MINLTVLCICDGEYQAKVQMHGVLESSCWLRPSDDLTFTLSKGGVSCVVYFLSADDDTDLRRLSLLKGRFKLVPVIVVVPDKVSFDVLFLMGKIGVEKVIGQSDLGSIEKHIKQTKSANVQIKLSDLEVSTSINSIILKESLKIIEQHYLTLMTIQDVSNQLCISECTLSREFRKANIPTPKRMLVLFKIMHATTLMKNASLNISEISYRSGFSNVKRFIDCFYRVHQTSPSEFRRRMLCEEEGNG